MTLSLSDGRQLSDEVLEAFRIRALHGIEMGFSEADLADILGVTRETVSRWWTAYRAGGLEALPQDRPGRPLGADRLLSDEQGKRIQLLLDKFTPEQLGIASALWTRRAVGALVEKVLGIHLAERTVGEYLRRWGYTPKKPQRHARKQDPDEVQQWLEETYPKIEKQAVAEDAEIHWCDETGMAADHQPGKSYSREGERATMETPSPHIHMNQISTITNEGAVRFMTYEQTMDAALFLVFLGRLLKSADRKILLIADRLPAHTDATVEQWLAAHRNRIEIFYLPRYSPEMNPVEYLNNDMKESVNAAGLPEKKETLRSRMQKFMRKLLRLPDHVANYFLNPSVQYASVWEL